MRYRWVRTLGEGGWKTTMTVLSVSSDTVQTSAGPQAVSRKVPVSRIEIGDARSPARIFDAEGRMLFMLPTTPVADGPRASSATALPAQLEAVRGAAASFKASLATAMASGPASEAPADARSRAWADDLLPSVAGRGARRAVFARDMGAPQGLVHGLERFVQDHDGGTTEVLTDPAWSVPVEINVVRGGRSSRTASSPTRRTRASDSSAGACAASSSCRRRAGDRALVDLELSSIRLSRGGLR